MRLAIRAGSRLLASMLVAVVAACSSEGGDRESDPSSDLHSLAKQSLGPVQAELLAESVEHRFGDRVTFHLRVQADDGAELEELDFGARMGHFRIRDREDRSRPEDGVLEHVLETEAERTGINLCRAPVIRFRVAEGAEEGAGTWHDLRLPSIELEVLGIEAGEVPDLAELGEPLALVGFSKREGERRWMLYAAGALLLVAATAIVLWRRRRPDGEAAPVELDPAEEAERALQRLLARDLVLQGRFGEFYLELTAIVRRYLERTTGIHAVEQTTEEFLREAEDSSAISADRRQKLRDFLQASDYVKFAAQVPSAAEIDASVDAARAFCRPDQSSAVSSREHAA